MRCKIFKITFATFITCILFYTCAFAGTLIDSFGDNVDPDSFSMDSDGKCSWSIPAEPTGYAWKRFGVQLLKRVTTVSSSGNTYAYKTSGSVHYAKADETEYTFTISSVGYYQFQFRCEDLEGNYGPWLAIYDNSTWSSSQESYPGVEVTEDDISAGGGSSGSGSGSSVTGGPGVVQTGSLPAGYQYAVVGPNGEILYYYGGNQSNNYYQNQYQYSQGSSQYYGPGFTNNQNTSGQTLTPQTGVSNYPQVTAPNTTGTTQQTTGQTNYQQQGTSVQTNPNYSGTSTDGGSSSASPQITQGLEVGWHVDGNGRFYYQGNGQILKGTWYLIDGSYYRFGDNGYLMQNTWYKDSSTGSYYYLAADGKMLVGWQKLNDVWYYFKPENGNGYGTMYSNTSIYINDAQYGQGTYAFDSSGAMVKNAWYGGYYYGQDGRRQN